MSTDDDGSLVLPVSRIRTIMKSSPDVPNIGQDAIAAMTKATELFIQMLAKNAHKSGKQKKNIDYADLANMIQNKTTLEFLHEIIPRKLTVRECYQLMESQDEESD